jgi:hypothetical protein
MKTRRTTIVVALTLAALAGSGAARAQTTPTTVTYSPGWTMVGAPPGTDLSSLAPLYAWSDTSYFNPPSTTAVLCQGYWSLVAQTTTVTLAASNPGPTQDCSLQPGWNLVGNPFTVPALLPVGQIAFAVNPATGGYMQVPAIATGGAVWIYTDHSSSITLQQSPIPRTPMTLTISVVPSGPYTVHVGDVVQLFLSADFPSIASANPALLPLDQSGIRTILSCVGEPSCAFTTTQRFWTWHAAAAGTALITVTSGCAAAGTPCGPSGTIEVDIQP